MRSCGLCGELRNKADLHPQLYPFRKSVAELLASQGIGHACVYVDQGQNSMIRIFFFGGDLENHQINSFYINNTNLLRYFTNHFTEKMDKKLSKIDPYTVEEDYKSDLTNWFNILHSTEISLTQFLTALAPHKNLTKRQWEIVYWYLMGKTTEETATILGLSVHTVITHFNRIKEKLGCATKPQILSELLKYGLCFPNENINV